MSNDKANKLNIVKLPLPSAKEDVVKVLRRMLAVAYGTDIVQVQIAMLSADNKYFVDCTRCETDEELESMLEAVEHGFRLVVKRSE